MPKLWLTTLFSGCCLSASALLPSCPFVTAAEQSPQDSNPTFQGIIQYEGDHTVDRAELSYAIREVNGRNWDIAKGTFLTDGSGNFSFTPEADWKPGRKVILVVTYPANVSQPMLGAEIDISAYLQGSEPDLGAIEIHQPLPIAYGRVTTQTGDPIAHAKIALMQGNPDTPIDFTFGPPPLIVGYTDENGEFGLNAFQLEPDLMLFVDAEGYLPQQVGLPTVTSNVDLSLLPGWRMRGSIWLGEPLPNLITMEIVGMGSSQSVPFNRASAGNQGGEFSFADDFPPGKYALISEDITGFRHEFELGPEGGLHDLGVFDLAGKVTFVTIHVTDQDGETPLFLHAQDGEGRWQGNEHDGAISLTLYGDPRPIYIGGRNTKWVRVDNPKDGMKVVLEPGLPVKLKLKPIPKLPPGWGVQATLTSMETDQPFTSMSVSWNLHRGIVRPPFPGKYQCELYAYDFAGLGQNGYGGIESVGIPVSAPDSPLEVIIEDTTEPQIIYLELPQEQLDAMEKAIAERE